MKESVKRMGRGCARGLLALAAVFAAGPLFGAVRPGVWGGAFEKAKAYAEAQAVPLVVFWGSPGCGQCSKLWKEASGGEFKNWMADSGEGGGAEMVFVHCEGVEKPDTSACKAFAKTANGNVLSSLPFIRIYWRNAAGEVVTVNFPGRKSTMPASSKGRTLAGQLIASIQAYTWEKGYGAGPAYAGGAFAVAGGAARLEIEEGLTERVEIPFRRAADTAGLPATNILTVAPIGKQAVITTNTVPGEPTAVVTTNFVNWTPFKASIVWAAGQTKASVVYPVPQGEWTEKKAAMTLTDGEGNPVENGTSAIFVVPPRPNSVANPYWIGERTAETLEWGEWTMDLDLATNKAAAAEEENACTLVLVTGSLWCPDCFSIEPNVFEKPEFTAWAQAKHVTPVILDVKVTVDDADITLLGYGEYNGRSGASYRSRKGILQADADPVIERNLKLRNNEIWRLPGTDKPRMWVPTVLLLRKDGTIAGRMDDDEITDPTHQKPPSHPLETNLARLDELLLLAGDRFEENDCHWSSTERLLAPGEQKPASGELQANDRVDVWRLDAGSRDGIGAFRVRAGLPRPEGDYSLKLYSVDAGGAVSECAVSEKQEGGCLALTGDVPCRHEKGVFLEIRGSEEGFPDNVTNSTSRGYAFSYSVELLPQDADASWTVGDEEKITLALESNRVYRITSNPANCLTNLPAALEPVDEDAGLYRWTAGDGPAAIGVRPPCTNVEYRIFEPGAIGFAAAGQRVGDFAGTAEVTLVRTGGKSGPLSARVFLDAATSTAVNGVRYEWTDTTVEWADGDAAPKTVAIPLTMTPELEGEQDIVLKLDPAPGAGIARHAVTLFDTDAPVFSARSFGKTLYTGIDGSFRVKVYNIKTGKSVKLNLEEGKLPRGIKAAYDKEAEEVVFSGKPSLSGGDAEFRAVYTVSERREDGTAAGLPAEFVFTVLPIEGVAPGYGTSLSLKGIPMLLAVGGNGARILAGTLDLSLSRSSRISAKYKGLGNGRTVSFSAKGWGAFDPDDAGGVLTASVESRSGQTFELRMTGDGRRFRADVHDPDLGEMTAVFPSTSWSAEHSAAAYEGLYTVALPQEPSILEALPEDGAPVPTGAGYLTLKIAGSSLKSGSVRYAGCYPNGYSFSGSGVLIDRGGYALLPVFAKSGKDVLGCMLTILPGKKGAHEGDAARAVFSRLPQYDDGGALPYWLHEEPGYAFALGLNPYGSYYDKDELLSDCCLDSHGTVDMRLVAPDAVAPSERYGRADPGSIPSGTVRISGNKLLPLEDARNVKKLSLKASSGIVSGSFSLGFMEQRRPLSLTFKGVVTPGWFSCPSCGDGTPDEDSHPFISGTAWFTDRHGNRSIRRSIRIDLDAGPVPEAGVPGT